MSLSNPNLGQLSQEHLNLQEFSPEGVIGPPAGATAERVSEG